MYKIVKVDFYDNFNCTADQCSFTCCEGWDILIDTETYNTWKSNPEQSRFIGNHIKTKKENNETEHYLKMDTRTSCPFLDQNGLCSVVIKLGDDALPKTCKTFPRQENTIGGVIEHSLTCACPVVVDIMHDKDSIIEFSYSGDEKALNTVPLEYNIREAMISLMQNSSFPLKDRILLVFHMLLFMKKEPDMVIETISNYQDESYLLSLIPIWNETEANCKDSLEETNELFLDIVQNYQNKDIFRYYLKDIFDLAEEIDIELSHLQWDKFNTALGQYDQLMENSIVLKIFSNCISENMDDLILAFQIIVTEYIMLKHSAFLKWLIAGNEKIEYPDVRDYLVIYSRIIGYNMDGMIEFWEDSFDETVWELGYLLLLIP